MARSIPNPYTQARTLAAAALAVAAGDPGRARPLADRAETMARSIPNPYTQARTLAAAALAVAAGDPGRARQLADRAETMARSITMPEARTRVLVTVAEAFVAAGDPDRVETMARSITDPYMQASMLAAAAEALAATGDPDRAGRLLCKALAVASWQVPLPVLARHWPQVVLRCANGLSGNERSRDVRTPPNGDPDHRSSSGQ
jgi:ATP/maltotriose-dependent transcriptional regulator MalT